MAEEYDSLRWYDYMILVVVLGISLSIGIYYAVTGNRQKSPKEYFLGGRKMNVFPMAFSQLVTRISGISIMGFPAEFYNYGITAYTAWFWAMILIIPTSYVLVPTLYDLGFTSTNEYLDARFKTKILRILSAVLFLGSQTMYLGLVTYAPALAMEALAGVPFLATVLVTSFVCTVYSTIGGLRGVVGTDIFQGIVMLGGCLLVLIIGSINVGGISEVWNIAMENDRMKMNFTLSPFVRISFFTAALSSLNTITVPMDQKYYQRIASMRSKSAAMWMPIVNFAQNIGINTLLYLCGMVVFAYYYKLGCDPLQSGQLRSSNQLFPFFIMDGLKIPGMSGLFIAVLFSAVLSSISSSLNSLSAVTWKDFLEPYVFKDANDSKRTLINKATVLIYGVAGLGFTFMYANMRGNFLQITSTVFSAFGGPMDGVYFVGFFCPWVEWKAAVIGLFGGFSLQAALSFGASLHYPYRETLQTSVDNCTALGFNNTVADYGENMETNGFFMISFYLYGVISTGTTVVITLIISIFIRNKSPMDPKLVVPVADRLFCCLPAKWRKVLRCGADAKNIEDDKTDDIENKTVKDSSTKLSGQEDQSMTKFWCANCNVFIF